MSTHNIFLWRNKSIVNSFWLKKNDDLMFYIPFNIIEVISRLRKDDNEMLLAKMSCILPPV